MGGAILGTSLGGSAGASSGNAWEVLANYFRRGAKGLTVVKSATPPSGIGSLGVT
jgi:hypothetical protein